MTLKKSLKAVSWLLIIVLIAITILLIGVRVVGFQVFTVLSPSMEPTYPVGSLVYVSESAKDEIKVGTPITFKLGDDIIATHRVVKVLKDKDDPSKECYRTKGDNNDIVDGPITKEDDVIGVAKFSIPGLGYLAEFIKQPPGTYFAILIGLAIIVFAFIPDLLADKKVKKKRE